MGRICGLVTSAEQLPPKKGQEVDPERGPLYSISIEGISLLCSSAVALQSSNGGPGKLPVEGQEIDATFEVRWRKGARPIHFCRFWQPA